MTQTQKLIALAGLCVALVLTWPGAVPLAPIADPSPFPADKLCVLVIEQQEDRTSLPAKQVAILSSPAIREYVKAKGGEFRIADPDQPADLDAKWVQDALKVERKELPVLIVGSPKGGTSERLPNDVDSMLATLKKYGGE